jgi:hypothetical protein
MKDLMCPACNSRSVPFWKTYWMFGPFATVQCTACGTRLRYSLWRALSLQFLLLIPGLIVLIALLAIPYVGIPLAILFWFGGSLLEVRTRKLKPVKT